MPVWAGYAVKPKIAQSWEIKEGKAKAMQIERYIKKLSRADKDKLVMDPHLLEAFLLDRAPCRQESI